MRECDETAEETKAQSTAQLVSGGRSVRALLPESQPALSWSGTKNVWNRSVANSHGSLIFLLGEKISDSDLNLTGKTNNCRSFLSRAKSPAKNNPKKKLGSVGFWSAWPRVLCCHALSGMQPIAPKLGIIAPRKAILCQRCL